MSESRYPLKWPGNWPRTPARARKRAEFRMSTASSKVVDGVAVKTHSEVHVTLTAAVDRLEQQFRLLEVTRPVLTTNVELRLDGRPRSGQRDPDDPGASVYFKLNGADRCLACDKWDRVADNIAALAAHIDALRRIDRYGVGGIDQAFRGYTALQPATTEWWLVLGVPKDATVAQIEAAFLTGAKTHHPDRGGSHHAMARLTEARALALALHDEVLV